MRRRPGRLGGWRFPVTGLRREGGSVAAEFVLCSFDFQYVAEKEKEKEEKKKKTKTLGG